MNRTLKTTARIVIVEDNPDDILLVRKSLEARGIKANLTCFEDGHEALANLRRKDCHIPDVLILDLSLPSISGVDLLRAVRHMPKFVDVPILVLTASDSAADQLRASMLGVAHYIKKPFSAREFLQEVGQSVEDVL
jgi:CheY-like chemotaxis protein